MALLFYYPLNVILRLAMGVTQDRGRWLAPISTTGVVAPEAVYIKHVVDPHIGRHLDAVGQLSNLLHL